MERKITDILFINSPQVVHPPKDCIACLRGLHHGEALIIVITHSLTECPSEVPRCGGPHGAAEPKRCLNHRVLLTT